jgi:hypothetical protein
MNPELLALACLLLFFQNPDQQAKLVRAQAQTRMEHESAHTGMMPAESGHGQDDITSVVVRQVRSPGASWWPEMPQRQS